MSTQENLAGSWNSAYSSARAVELVPDQTESHEELVSRLQYAKLNRPTEALLQQAAKVDLLTLEDEIELGRLVQQGDLEARNKMVTANIRLAAMVARKFETTKLDFEDLLHEGIAGLFKAAEAYDPDSGNRFSTFATLVISQHIRKAIARMGHTISLPYEKYKLIGSALTIEAGLVQEQGRAVTAEEIANHIGAEYTRGEEKNSLKTAADVKLVKTIGKGSVSLDIPVQDNPDDTLQDFLADEDDISERALENVQSTLLKRALERLSEDERKIINVSYGLTGQEPLSRKTMSKIWGVSESTIVKMRADALDKLRTAAEEEGLGV